MNKRLICFLLVFLMCLSLAPTVLGTEDDNAVNDTTGDPIVESPPPVSSGNPKTTKSKQGEETGKEPPPPAEFLHSSTASTKSEILGLSVLKGLRFTLYFFEDAESYSDMYDDPVEGRLYSKAVNLGNIDLVWDVKSEYFNDKVYWSVYDIYDRMGDREATNSPYKMGSDGKAGLNLGGNYLKDQAVGTGDATVAISSKGGDTLNLDKDSLDKLKAIYDDSLSGAEKTNRLNLFFVGNKEGMSLTKATEYVKGLNNNANQE